MLSGHLVFIFIHIAAVVFVNPLLLVITVAAHKFLYDASISSIHKTCPDCKEIVLREARICKHCRHDFSATIASPAQRAANKPSGWRADSD